MVKYIEWLKLNHYIEIELLQGDITEATYRTLEDALLTLKPEGEPQEDTSEVIKEMEKQIAQEIKDWIDKHLETGITEEQWQEFWKQYGV